MKLLAIDTATEQCSAAILTEHEVWSRIVPTARSHADLILPMIDELLHESGLKLVDMDGLAFGRGPGSFTGVRIAVSVVQGLALAVNKRVVGVSNLAAVAQQVAAMRTLQSGANILVCMDARMHEIYWARYRVVASGSVVLVGNEHVSPPAALSQEVDAQAPCSLGVGTGWRAYPELRDAFANLQIHEDLLPRATDVAQLAMVELRAGGGVRATDAQPVYLRDQVAVASR